MQVLRLHPDRRLRLHDEPVPEPGPDEALVRVAAVGLCGSDSHWVVDGGIGDAVLGSPLVLGHEFGGVAETGRHRGRLVAVDPAIPCEQCETCRSGASNLCPEIRFAGHGQTDGALRELVAWPERCLHPLSDRLSPVESALVEPLAIAVHALDVAGPVMGATVAVVGCGPIGLLIVALARALGAASIVAIDPLAHRRDAATAYGATVSVEPAPDGDAEGHALALSGARGMDVCVDAAGDADAVDAAVALARPGGEVILVGIPSDDRTAFRASVARRKGLTIKLVRRSTVEAFGRAVESADRRSVDLAGLVTTRVALTDAQSGFDALIERSGLKVVVEPGQPA